MISLTLSQLADVVGGELPAPADGERVVDDVVIDSRTAGPGALFVPLPGEHADGHDFIADAAARGAAGYLLAAKRPVPDAPGAVIVDDPADALLGLGAWVREHVDPFVVAITGSQGKTTTKDLMTGAIGAGRKVTAAPGSYNNELGVPLTCCRLEADTHTLICELGVRGMGDIAALAPLVRPDVAVVTAVGASHLERLGSIDAVAQAKGELVEALTPEGTAVLNADDERVAAMAERTPARVVTYGLRGDADWRAEDVTADSLGRARFVAVAPDGRRAPVRLALPGAHNVANALAALAVADLAGVDLDDAAAGLARAPRSPWRMALHATPAGGVVLNDAYNANPASTQAALEALARLEVPGAHWAVLGHMAELGGESAAAHRRVGAQAADLGLDGLVVVGSAADDIAAGAHEAGFAGMLHRAADPDEALGWLADHLDERAAVLVKASRSVGLERLAEELVRRLGADADDGDGA